MNKLHHASSFSDQAQLHKYYKYWKHPTFQKNLILTEFHGFAKVPLKKIKRLNKPEKRIKLSDFL